MKLADGWVPLALSSSIEAGTSAGAVAGGQEIVVWRDNSGHAHAWEDRCPHRGMRLSLGFVRGDHIACLYHGWQYDTAGQCRLIPAHPALDVPATIKVPVYRTEETYGIIWATTDADAVLPEIDKAGDLTEVRSLYVDCPLDAAEAALHEEGFTRAAAQIAVLDRGDDRLLIGLQRIGPEQTALHIVLLGATDIAAGDKRKHHAKWAEALRARLEAGVPSMAKVAS